MAMCGAWSASSRLLPKSLSTHEARFFRRHRRAKSKAHFRACWCQALPACRRCWVLALQNSVYTVKNCYAERWAVVLSALLLLWLARALHGPCFVPFVFGPSGARDPSHKTLLFAACCRVCVSGCSFEGPTSWHPRHHLGLEWATTIT